MPNKPVHLKVAGPKNDRQAMWGLIREQRKGFSARDIRQLLPGATSTDTIRSYLNGLAAAGYLEQTSVNPKRYKLVNDVGIEAPRVNKTGEAVTQGLGQERMWQTLRLSRAPLTALEICANVTDEKCTMTATTASSYLGTLAKAGYLITNGTGDDRRYRLIPGRNSGPRPPMIQRTKHVFDPNLGTIVWRQEADHA